MSRFITLEDLEIPRRRYPDELPEAEMNPFVRGNVTVEQNGANVERCCGWDLDKDEAYAYDFSTPGMPPIRTLAGGIIVAWKKDFLPTLDNIRARLS